MRRQKRNKKRKRVFISDSVAYIAVKKEQILPRLFVKLLLKSGERTGEGEERGREEERERGER